MKQRHPWTQNRRHTSRKQWKNSRRTGLLLLLRTGLSTVRKADLLYVMNNGEIIEQGSHEQLMKMKGIFQSLYEEYDIFEKLKPRKNYSLYQAPVYQGVMEWRLAW